VVLVDSFVNRADTEAGNERGMICKFCADALVVKMFILQITRLLLFVFLFYVCLLKHLKNETDSGKLVG
jgi:hypothetical protein